MARRRATMLTRDELTRSAAKHLFPRLKSTSLTIHRFTDFGSEETLEVHRCPRRLIGPALFWQLSVENRFDFVPGDPGYRDHYLRDALCRPAEVEDVLQRYEGLRKGRKGDRFADFLAQAGVLVRALVMIDGEDEWCVLGRTRRQFVAIHWGTVAREDEDPDEE